jgi:hypothetical protein
MKGELGGRIYDVGMINVGKQLIDYHTIKLQKNREPIFHYTFKFLTANQWVALKDYYESHPDQFISISGSPRVSPESSALFKRGILGKMVYGELWEVEIETKGCLSTEFARVVANLDSDFVELTDYLTKNLGSKGNV